LRLTATATDDNDGPDRRKGIAMIPREHQGSSGTGKGQLGAPSAQIVMTIDPTRKRRVIDVQELWSYREVVFFLVWRDFKVKYRQTYLGVLWAMLQPLIAMSVFSIFFGRLVGIPSNGTPYPLFVLCGLVPWNFFSRTVGSMTGSLIQNQELVKRIYFPRIIIPTAAMVSSMTDLIPGFIVIFFVLAAYTTLPAAQILLLPIFILMMAVAVMGLGLALSAWNVRFRDVGYLVPFTLQIFLFITPIVYPGNLVPQFWRPVYSLNPMVGVVEAIRWCVLGTPADWTMVAISCACSVMLLIFGLVVFSRAERSFPDLI
jgi:lipopolysaccharide transport system permease protein